MCQADKKQRDDGKDGSFRWCERDRHGNEMRWRKRKALFSDLVVFDTCHMFRLFMRGRNKEEEKVNSGKAEGNFVLLECCMHAACDCATLRQCDDGTMQRCVARQDAGRG